jgi:FkbM family methyltransferase
MIELIKRAVKNIVGIFGLELRRKPALGTEEDTPPSSRATFAGALRQFSKLGFRPGTVIDVGVAFETETLHHEFRDSQILLIEPLVEFEPFLKGICHRYKAQYVLAAAGATQASRILNVRPDLPQCSSFLKDADGPALDGTPRAVPVVTLDQVCSERGLKGPYLIKIDVQGGELTVLDGATETLKQTEVAILEVSLFEMLIGCPLLYDVMAYMKQRGFVLYDTWGFFYRPYDGALAQMDIAFVREDGMFRPSHTFATPEQRKRIESQLRRPRSPHDPENVSLSCETRHKTSCHQSNLHLIHED